MIPYVKRFVGTSNQQFVAIRLDQYLYPTERSTAMAMSSNNSWPIDASYRLCTSTQKRLKSSEETLSSTSQMVKMGITKHTA